jgi:tRNA (cmo5U34)-methyltransferase
MVRDQIFQTDKIHKDFVFDDKVANVFENMLARSVPFYGAVNEMTAGIVNSIVREGERIYDLGCSLGTTLLQVESGLKPKSVELIGVDNSVAMLEKAKEKAAHSGSKCHFEEGDITAIELKPSACVIMNYTLQFLRPILREDFLRKIFDSLRPGGALLLSEKVILHDPLLNRKFIDYYTSFKSEQGYSQMEISKKREALENVLIPFSIEENLTLLKRAGFAHVDSYFQWFNFCSFIAVKGE